jgi:hypothetical protein
LLLPAPSEESEPKSTAQEKPKPPDLMEASLDNLIDELMSKELSPKAESLDLEAVSERKEEQK